MEQSRSTVSRCFKVFHVGLAPAAQFNRSPIVLSLGHPVQCSALVQSSNRAQFAGSVSCFTSIAIDRVDTCMYAYVWCDHSSDQSKVFRVQANDVTWPAVACVWKSMKLGMHSV